MISVKLYNNKPASAKLNKNIDFPFRTILSEQIKKASSDFNQIVVAGIGGSDLGTRAIFNALLHPYNNEFNDKKIYFSADTTDPDQILSLFEILKLPDTLFILVSKSGETIELKTFLEIVVTKLTSAELDLKEHLWIITDPKVGEFRKFADENNIKTFDIPENIGGRYSVLTNVGLIPSSVFGIDTLEILRGAEDLDEYFFKTKNDFVSQYVNFKLSEYESGKNISVLLPYKYGLKEFAKWYQQLWSESLGKDGKGQTPVAMLGPVDQHSQLQLMLDGPEDKFITVIKVTESAHHDNKLNDILNIEADATIEALEDKGKSLVVIELPELNEYYIGQLFYFFQLSVCLFASSLDINAFDQPAVESVKQNIQKKVKSL
jgi:glucose-6-phosphate isomerase